MATFDLREGIEDADLVILCTPVLTILEQIRTIRPHLKKSAMVIDVGSSKESISHEGDRFLGEAFVGCHPMAGSELRGIMHANERLFEGEICFMTSRNKRIQNFWTAIGADVHPITPKRHDRWVAMASHLPHILAFSLLANPELQKDFPGRLNPSIRDFARIARGSGFVWPDIFLSNKTQVITALNKFKINISKWSNALKRSDKDMIIKLIADSNRVSWMLEDKEYRGGGDAARSVQGPRRISPRARSKNSPSAEGP